MDFVWFVEKKEEGEYEPVYSTVSRTREVARFQRDSLKKYDFGVFNNKYRVSKYVREEGK